MVSWEYINWSITRHYVSRLQRRIYKAAFQQKYGKMRKLQDKLLLSPRSKLLSVFIVLQSNIAFWSKCITNCDKIRIAKHLNVKENSDFIYEQSCKLLKVESRHQRALHALIKRSQQLLAEFVFKPEWKAKCSKSLLGLVISDFDNKRKITKIIRSIYKHRVIYTLVLDVAMYKFYGNYIGIINRLSQAQPVFLQQYIKKWLEKENLLAFKARKLLYNNIWLYTALKKNSLPIQILISLLIDTLRNYCVLKKSSKSLKCFVHNSQLFLLCDSVVTQKDCVNFIQSSFSSLGADIRLVRLYLSNVLKGFEFIGYKIQNREQRFLVTMSKKTQMLLWSELSNIIQKSKSVSSYQLIQRLSPKVLFWSQYFKYTRCLKIFAYLDYLLHLRIWIWTLRRHPMQSKTKIKQKYFPQNKQYIYKKQLIRSNWILYGYLSAGIEKSKKSFLLRFLWLLA
uniref:Reverse transcriptase N-terminal domain-containing protein n=1 Tax=Hildenbrandia rivularis TaxID=135206 RepID=A0A1C9CFB2_9FLOR|nr:hypothetical protein Hrvl_013 [Hildenbrandia rivularis]AOM67073.1 hypothetical protein Hrvl_013 [Hildenbrandia rivularis]